MSAELEGLRTSRTGVLAYLHKADHEGGLVGYLRWGGVDRFPVELRPAAADLHDALKKLEDAERQLCVDREIDPDDLEDAGWWDEDE